MQLDPSILIVTCAWEKWKEEGKDGSQAQRETWPDGGGGFGETSPSSSCHAKWLPHPRFACPMHLAFLWTTLPSAVFGLWAFCVCLPSLL